jgi:hypothetical protein
MFIHFGYHRINWIQQEIKKCLKHFVFIVFMLTVVVVIALIAKSKHTTFLTFDASDFEYQYKPKAKPFNQSFEYNVLLNGHCHTNVGM